MTELQKRQRDAKQRLKEYEELLTTITDFHQKINVQYEMLQAEFKVLTATLDVEASKWAGDTPLPPKPSRDPKTLTNAIRELQAQWRDEGASD